MFCTWPDTLLQEAREGLVRFTIREEGEEERGKDFGKEGDREGGGGERITKEKDKEEGKRHKTR